MLSSDVNNFTTGAASQISCSVTNGFGQITTEVEKLPDEVQLWLIVSDKINRGNYVSNVFFFVFFFRTLLVQGNFGPF